MELFQQPKITGYRQLSEAEAALMNEIKEHGERLGALVDKLRDHTGVCGESTTDEGCAAVLCVDQRWVSIGATDLQTGLMALTRAVAKPTTF